MTSIEWLIDRIDISNPFMVSDSDIEKAKEMHKQEIIDAFKSGLKSPYHQDYTFVTQDNQEGTKSGQYYTENYTENYPKLDVSKGSDTLKDYHIVDTNEMAQLPQQEISDEEIEKAADKQYDGIWDCEKFEEGAKWYREQLKSK